MKTQLNKVFENLIENEQIIRKIITQLRHETPNETTKRFLEIINNCYHETPLIEVLIHRILEEKLHKYDIGDKLPKNISSTIDVYISEDYTNGEVVSLHFYLNDNRTITDIRILG